MELCTLEILIPLAGAATLAWLMYANKKSGTVHPAGAVTVDLARLLKSSKMNTTWKSSTIPRTTGAERVSNATISANEWLESGYPMAVVLAALVNADYESRMSNRATGDNGNAIGLYQLSKTGAGKGMSESDMRNPSLNTRALMKDFKFSGEPVMSAYRAGSSVAQLSGLFGKYVERTANKNVIELRGAYARSLFPSIANIEGLKLV